MTGAPVPHGYPSFDESVADAASAAVRDGRFSAAHGGGTEEGVLGRFTGFRYVALTGTGFAALQATLLALGARPGHTVVAPTLTCPSVYHAARSTGAAVVLGDVGLDQPLLADEATHGLPPDHTIVVVAQMFGLRRSTGSFAGAGFATVEDGAQAFGPNWDRTADVAVTSFSATKLLTTGYGGAAMTSSERVRARMLRVLDVEHDADEAGTPPGDPPFRLHCPMSGFQRAMLAAQLHRHAEVVDQRRRVVERYDELLDHPARLHPEVPFRYQLVLDGGAKEAAALLQARGVHATAPGSHLLHRTLNLPGQFPNAERWADRLLSLPLHERVSEDDAARVARAASDVLARERCS